MERFFENYISGLSMERFDESHLKGFRVELEKEPPVLHIPSWKFLRKDKYEIVVKNYAAVIYGRGKEAVLRSAENEEKVIKANVFRILQSIEKICGKQLPYYFGLLSYDLHNMIKPPERNVMFYNLPDYYLIFPGDMLIINHTSNEDWRQRFKGKKFQPECSEVKIEQSGKEILFSEREEDYLQKINSIRDLIFEGEVYQVNYTTRLSQSYPGCGYTFFKKLYAHNPAPFSFYARLPFCEIISNSPERFLLTDKRRIVTEPIKGTIKRMHNQEEDNRQKEILLKSEKDAAELSMIVDLLRNDISKVCLPGSVRVTDHKRLETFRNVHHLVSTIEGELAVKNNFVDLLEAAFPGGSISGCPKMAALNYIRKLEEHNRSFYTGSFFIRCPKENQFDSNILIRTGILTHGQIHFQVGGGIVIDSDPQAEYRECLAKADSFLRVAGNLE